MSVLARLPSLVILDRDGVINEDSDEYIKTPDEWQPIKGALEAIKQLKTKGIPVAIATNQSGIARGLFSFATLQRMHAKLFSLLGENADAIHYIAVCPHGPDAGCVCRKPKIGLLEEISRKLSMPLNRSVYFVGDSLKDLQAAKSAGCTPVLVKTGKGQRTLASSAFSLQDVAVFDKLEQFTDTLV